MSPLRSTLVRGGPPVDTATVSLPRFAAGGRLEFGRALIAGSPPRLLGRDRVGGNPGSRGQTPRHRRLVKTHAAEARGLTPLGFPPPLAAPHKGEWKPIGPAGSKPAQSAGRRGMVASYSCAPPLRSADGRGVLQASLGPLIVQATLDLEAGAGADVAVERLAIVADLFDDAIGPVVVEAEALAVVAFLAEQALDVGVGGARHLIDVALGHAQLLGAQQRVVHPFDDGEPLRVALA